MHSSSTPLSTTASIIYIITIQMIHGLSVFDIHSTIQCLAFALLVRQNVSICFYTTNQIFLKITFNTFVVIQSSGIHFDCPLLTQDFWLWKLFELKVCEGSFRVFWHLKANLLVLDPPKTDLQTSPVDMQCFRLCGSEWEVEGVLWKGVNGRWKRVNEGRMHNEVSVTAERPRGSPFAKNV